MQRSTTLAVAFAFGCGLLAGMVVVSDMTQPRQVVAAPNEPAILDTLTSDVAVLKDKATDQARVMADVEYCRRTDLAQHHAAHPERSR